MAVKPTPLAVAAVSAVLLVAVLAVDAGMNRTFSLDVRGVDGWVTVATSDEGRGYPRAVHSLAPVTVADNGSVEFRLRVDNGYPWTFSGTYDAHAYGEPVAQGEVSAGARSAGTATFTVDLASLTQDHLGPRPAREPHDRVYLEVLVDEDVVGGEVAVREAGA